MLTSTRGRARAKSARAGRGRPAARVHAVRATERVRDPAGDAAGLAPGQQLQAVAVAGDLAGHVGRKAGQRLGRRPGAEQRREVQHHVVGVQELLVKTRGLQADPQRQRAGVFASVQRGDIGGRTIGRAGVEGKRIEVVGERVWDADVSSLDAASFTELHDRVNQRSTPARPPES